MTGNQPHEPIWMWHMPFHWIIIAANLRYHEQCFLRIREREWQPLK